MQYWLDNPNIEPAITLLLSAAIGLLVGLERERNPHAKARLRTFALIALLGTFAAWLAQATSNGWLLGTGLLAVCLPIAGAYFADPATREDDSGTTTVIAALLVFALGAALAFGYRVFAALSAAAPEQTLRNPVQLRTALVFAAIFALVLLLSAWLSMRIGTQGVYAAALVSGLTDVDATTLSSLQLFAQEKLTDDSATVSIGLAVIANLLFKTNLVFSVGGAALGRRWCVGVAWVLLGLLAGPVALLH